MICWRSVFANIVMMRVTLFFYVAYIVTNYIYVKLPRALELNYGVIFVTSPFNLLENLSHIYANPTQGLEANFWIVLLFILLAEIYSRFAHARFVGTGIDGAFALALGASYATSALWWQVKGVPESGTSIVSFSIVLYLLVISLADARINIVPYKLSIMEKIKFPLWITSLGTSCVAAPTYILGNPSYEVHLVGITFFGAFLMLLILYRLKRNRQTHPSSGSKAVGIEGARVFDGLCPNPPVFNNTFALSAGAS